MVGKFRNNSNVCHGAWFPRALDTPRELRRRVHDSDAAAALTGSPVLGERPGRSRSGLRLPRDSDAQPRMGYSKSAERDLDRKGVSAGV